MSFSSICFQKLARRRARSVGFVERVVVTPRAWHKPEKTDRRVELGCFSRFSKLMSRRWLGIGRFPRFVSKGWQNDAPGHSSTCTSDLYRHRVRFSRLSPSAGRAGPVLAWWTRPDPTSQCGRPGQAALGRYRRSAGLRNATGGKASAHTTGRASACDRRPGFGTRPGFGAHDRARFRHAASSADPP